MLTPTSVAMHIALLKWSVSAAFSGSLIEDWDASLNDASAGLSGGSSVFVESLEPIR